MTCARLIKQRHRSTSTARAIPSTCRSWLGADTARAWSATVRRPCAELFLGHCRTHRGADLLHGRLQVLVGALGPVLAVEEFERQVAAKAVVSEVAQDLAERRDAVARVDPVTVVEG